MSLSRLILVVFATLGGIATAAQPPLSRGKAIEITESSGKFDFLSIDPVRHRLLAAHEKDETADFFDLNTNTIISRLKTGPTVGIAVDSKTGRYFASVQDDKRVAIIDPNTLQETGSVLMDGETDAILFDAKDRRVYVTNDNGTLVWAIDADSAKVVASISIPGAPECMAIDETSGRLFLNIKTGNEIAVIDTQTNKIVALWSTTPATGPHGIAFDPLSNHVMASGENGILVAIDTESGKVDAQAPIVEKVDQIALDPDWRRVYCAGPGTLSVVEITKAGLVPFGSVATAVTAKNVAVDPQTHTVWTTYTDGKSSFAQAFNTTVP